MIPSYLLSGHKRGALGLRYLGAASAQGGTISAGASFSGGLPDTLQKNDIVILSGASRSGVPATPSGYTLVTSESGNGTYSRHPDLAVWYKILTGPWSEVTISADYVIAQAWRGVDLSTPLDVAATKAPTNGPNTVTADPPSITPSTSGAVIVVAGAFGDGGEQSITGWTGLSAVTAQYRSPLAIVGGAMAYYEWSSGAYDPAAWSISGPAPVTNSGASAITLALRPAT